MDKQMQDKVRILNHTTEMQPSTKNILLDLVTFLNTRTAEAAKLWWVLTALRGPDNDSNRTKTATTCVIRDAVGLREGVGNGASVEEDQTSGPSERELLNHDFEMHHFRMHAQKAFEVLGLGWDYNNAPVFVDFAKVEQNVLQSLMTKEITTKEPE